MLHNLGLSTCPSWYHRTVQNIISSPQGDKNEGFNVLYQNMKCGTLAAKELTDFFRESAKLEEENAKTHAKLAKQVRLLYLE